MQNQRFKVSVQQPLGNQIAETHYEVKIPPSAPITPVSLQQELRKENPGWVGKLTKAGDTAGLMGTSALRSGDYVLVLPPAAPAGWTIGLPPPSEEVR